MKNQLKGNEVLKKDMNELGKKEFGFYHHNNTILLSIWNDHKLVSVVSTFHDNTIDQKSETIQIDGNYVQRTFQLPKMIKDYIIFIRGVDVFDRGSSLYNFDHKTYRWYLKIFFHYLEIAMRNSFIIYTT